MSDMKKLTIGSTEYTVVDQTARNSISNLATVATTGSYTDLSNTPPSANTNISDEYDSSKTYNTGDVVIHDSVLYICDGTSITGNWDSTKWIATTVKQLLSLKANSSTTYTKTEVDSALNNKQDKLYKGTLGSGVDLDTLYNNAVYYLAGATTAQHAPVSYGMLEVINATLTLQRITQVGPSGTTATQYERIYINNAWTSWRTITRS